MVRAVIGFVAGNRVRLIGRTTSLGNVVDRIERL